MKNLILISALIISFYTCVLGSNGDPLNFDESIILYQGEKVICSIDSKALKYYGLTIRVDSSEEIVTIRSKSNVDFVQIIDEKGELVYQLPIGSRELNVYMIDFLEGDYLVQLTIKNEPTIVSARINKK